MKNIKRIFAALLVVTMLVAMASTAMAYKEKDIDAKYVKFIGTAYGYDHVTNNWGKGKSNIALRKGTIAIAVAEKGNWYKIFIPGKAEEEYLWFCKDHLKDTKSTDMKYIFSSGGSGHSLPDGEEFEFTGFKKVQVLKGRKTNVRKTPSLKGKSLGVVRDGKKLKFLGAAAFDTRSVLFYKVKYDGKKAWVSSEYTTLLKK